MFIGLAQVKSTEVQCAISPADDFEGGREGGRQRGEGAKVFIRNRGDGGEETTSEWERQKG